MARASNLTICSFCGKSHEEVKKLIAGPGVYICDNCIHVCKTILDKEAGSELDAHPPLVVPKPVDLMAALDLHVIGQHHAKEPVAETTDWELYRQESYGDTKLSFFRRR